MKEKTIVEKNIAFVEAIREAGRGKEAINLLHMKTQDYGLTNNWKGGFTSDLLTSIYVAAQLEKLSLPPLTTENLVEFFSFLLREEAQKKETEKIGSYRKPRHLVNASTSVRPPKLEELNLFSSLDDTQRVTTSTPPMIGLDLNRTERKLVNCFSLILHQRSQTIDETKENYYSGDTDKPEVEIYGKHGLKAPYPELRLTLYELTKAYTRKDNPSGKDMKTVRNMLNVLSLKTYYVVFNPITYKDGKDIERKVRWRGSIPLFMLGDVDNGELLIQLNSIFALQIRDFYVNYPINYDELLEEANLKLCNTNRVATGVHIFIDYLASVRGVKGNYKHPIYKSNLYEKINYKWVKESRITMLEDNIERGINIAKEIGLLEKYEEVIGATGERMYIFYTRKDWIKR